MRGFRVEPGEVEAAVEAHPDVRQAMVQPHETVSGEVRLVAYYISVQPLDPAALRDFVAEKLPDFMIPTAFVEISALPLTLTGKVDRHALPKPEVFFDLEPEFASGDVERIVAAIVRSALGAAALSSTESLPALGLDSFGMSGILIDIEEAFSITVEAVDLTPELFQSVANLTGYVKRRLAEGAP